MIFLRLPAVLLGLLATPALAGTTFPIPLGTNGTYNGYIRSGSRFGVHIGDSREQAKRSLINKGLRDDGPFACERYVRESVACRPGDLAEVYRIQKFMYDGDVFVFVEGGKGIAIGWRADAINVDT